MQLNRDFYKKKLVKVAGNGLVKVITGIRRVGKSYLLFSIFRKILVVGGNAAPRLDNNGYVVVGVIPFLLDEAILDSTV